MLSKPSKVRIDSFILNCLLKYHLELTQAADCLSDPVSRTKYNVTRLSRQPAPTTPQSTPRNNYTSTKTNNRSSPAQNKSPSQNTSTSYQYASSQQPILHWEPNTFKPSNKNNKTPEVCHNTMVWEVI